MPRTFLTSLLAASVILSSCGNLFTRVSLYDRVTLSIVKTDYQLDETTAYTCTGFVVDAAKGQALTARHCVPDDDRAILVNDKESAVLKKDDAFALLKVPIMSQPPLDIRAKPLPAGTEVRTFGFAKGKYVMLPRTIAALLDGGHLALSDNLIAGMSGGPVVDMEGKVVGVNQGTFVEVQLGFACGQDEIRAFLK